MGWFRDAVASTKKRVATASGHNWVVMAVAFCVPGTSCVILALPLLARLHLPGKGQPSFDKQFVRDYLETLDWNKTPPAPALPPEVVAKTQAKYLEAYERLTGHKL